MSLYKTSLDDILPKPLTDKCIVIDLDICFTLIFNDLSNSLINHNIIQVKL